MEACPICAYGLKDKRDYKSHDYSVLFKCPNCGVFALSVKSGIVPDDKIEKAILSHAIRCAQKQDIPVEIDKSFINTIIQNRLLPSPKDQADNLIYWFGTNLKAGGKLLVVSPITHQAVAGSTDSDEFGFILEYLYQQDLIQGEANDFLSI
jgi:hypothetical protein